MAQGGNNAQTGNHDAMLLVGSVVHKCFSIVFVAKWRSHFHYPALRYAAAEQV
jgi:hypothetical protein